MKVNDSVFKTRLLWDSICGILHVWLSGVGALGFPWFIVQAFGSSSQVGGDLGVPSAGRKTYVSVVSLSHLQTTHTSPENRRKKGNHLRTKYYLIAHIERQL